jgi:hypothetical protein
MREGLDPYRMVFHLCPADAEHHVTVCGYRQPIVPLPGSLNNQQLRAVLCVLCLNCDVGVSPTLYFH